MVSREHSSGVWVTDIHFYNYLADVFDPELYPRAKFVSEFGFQSFPSWVLYRNYTSAEDWSRDSKMSAHRYESRRARAVLKTFSTPYLAGALTGHSNLPT